MGQAGLTLDHDVPRVGFLPLLHVSLREGTERERGVRGERDGWVLERVGCGREGNSRRATNRRSVSAHTSTPYISSSLVCITPNRTAYAKQQPPLRPRATEEMVVDIVFEWYRGVWADVSAGGAFSRPMMTYSALFETRVQFKIWLSPPAAAVLSGASTTPPVIPGRESDPSRCFTTIMDQRRPLRRGLSRTTATPSRRVSSARTTSDATPPVGTRARPGKRYHDDSDDDEVDESDKEYHGTGRCVLRRLPTPTPPSSLAPRRHEIPTNLAPSVPLRRRSRALSHPTRPRRDGRRRFRRILKPSPLTSR